MHSEFNASREAPVHFLQIWIMPDRKGVAPRCREQHFAPGDKRGRMRLIISPDGADGSLSVYQDVRVHAGLFDGDERQVVTLPENRCAYVHVARGSIEVNGEPLQEGDGARLRNVSELTFANGRSAEALLFDLRPNELPSH